MAIDASKIFLDSFENLNKNSEKVNISLSVPLNPVFVFYLSAPSKNFHSEIYNDLKSVWGNSADTIGYFSIDVSGNDYYISDIDGNKLSEEDFISKAGEVIEKFGEGYSKVHSYMFADTSNMDPDVFESLFKAGKEIAKKLNDSRSMLITILDESIGKEEKAVAIKRRLKDLREDPYNGTAVISNKCADNSIIQITPSKQEGFHDFNLFADIILLSNTRICGPSGNIVSNGKFYNSKQIFTVSYRNKTRPDKDRTAAILLETLKGFEDQIETRKMTSNEKTDNWKKLCESIKNHLVEYIYKILVANNFPKSSDFIFMPLMNRPKKKTAQEFLALQNYVVNSLTGNAANDYYTMNYVAEIDNYFENTLRKDDIKAEIREVLSTQSFIDIARHCKLTDIDMWTEYACNQESTALIVFETNSKNRILEKLKPIVKEILQDEINIAQNYINFCNEMVNCLQSATNDSVRIANIERSITDFYGGKVDAEISRKGVSYFDKFFAFVSDREELVRRFKEYVKDIVDSVYSADKDLFDADFTKEIRLRNPGKHQDEINSQINTELTRDYTEKMTLLLNDVGRHEEVYKLFMLDDTPLKECISSATTETGFELAFLNSGSNRFVEFIAVYSCEYEALIGG